MTPQLNAPGRFARYFADSRLTVLIIFAALVAGLWAVFTTPREENPQITMPAAMVVVALPGAGPSEIEELVVAPLERIINQVTGVDSVYAQAVDSAAVLSVRFKVSEDKQDCLVRLYDRVNGGRQELPPDAMAPSVIGVDSDDLPVVAVTLAGGGYDDYALRRIAERMVEGLQSIEDISTIRIWDGSTRRFEVTVDPDRLSSYGILGENVRLALMTSNLAAGLGDRAAGSGGMRLRYQGFVTSADDLRNLVVGGAGSRVIRLGDVAEVTDGPAAERESVSRWAAGRSSPAWKETGGREMPSVTFSAAKKKGVNSVLLAREVLERLERMKPGMLPAGVMMTVTRDDGAKADSAVNTAIEHVGVSFAAVFLVTWAFLGFRAALVCGLTIPLILSLTLFFNEAAGLTINRVSLFGFVIALGLLVDDTIIVVENTERVYRAHPEASRLELAALAVSEIGYPTMIATFTVMIVFYTLIPSLTGMNREYFFPIGFTVPAAVFSSLLIAYSVGPWACRLVLKPGGRHGQAAAGGGESGRNIFGRIYCRTAGLLIGRTVPTAAFFIAVALMMAVSLMQPLWQFIRPQGVSGDLSWFGVKTGYLPRDNRNTFNVTVRLADGTPIEITDRAVRDIAAIAREVPEVTDILSWAGSRGVADTTMLFRGEISGGSNVGAVRVNLVDKSRRSRSSVDIAAEVRGKARAVAARYPESTIQVVEEPAGPPMRAGVLAEIYCDDRELLRPLAERVRAEFAGTFDMVETSSTEMTGLPQAVFEVDQEKALLSGVVPAQAALALRRYRVGETVGHAHAPGERKAQPIVLRADYGSKPDPGSLSALTVKNARGADVPLSEIVSVRYGEAERTVMNRDGTPVVLVGGEVGTRSASFYAVYDLDRRLDGMEAGGGERLATGNLGLSPARADLSRARVQLLWDGEIRINFDAYHDLFIAISISMVAIFILLVGYYRSFLLPVIVMSAIPVCFIGIMPGHWVAGELFSATSMMGVVTLSGVVVRNSLLLSDFVVDYMKQGLPLREAVLDAGAMRIRPILITSLAIVFGSMIMLTDPIFSGLGCSFIFGTIASTTITMAMTPILLYWYFSRWPAVAAGGGEET